MSIPPPDLPAPSERWPAEAPPAMLAYSSAEPRRPSLVTALGVTSIVIASLSLLAGLWSGLMFLPAILFSSAAFTAPMPAAGQTTPANTLSPEAAETIAVALEGRQPLSPADHALLVQALQLSELPLAPPADGQWTAAHVTRQLNSRNTSDNGTTITTSFQFAGGSDISLIGSTATVNIWSANGDWTSTTVSGGAVTSSTTQNFGSGMTPFGGVSRGSVLIQGASVLLSLGLAVLLLVAGIQTLRSSPAGRKLHLWWAWPKIAVAVLGGFASYAFWSGMFADGMMTPSGGEDETIAMAFAAGSVLIAIAWPVTVLLLLRAPSLREYYSPPTAAGF